MRCAKLVLLCWTGAAVSAAICQESTKKSMKQNQRKSSPSVSRSVTLVDPPPFQEFFELFKQQPRQPDEFTVAEFLLATGMHEIKARRELNAQVESGKLTMRHLPVDGKRINLYRVK